MVESWIHGKILWRVVLVLSFLFVMVYSIPRLTTAPRLWLDEAKNIELAQSFNSAWRLDMEIAPGQFTGVPHLLQSTGYPVTIPLAFIFKIFGMNFTAARLYMLVWIFVTLCALYHFLKNMFGERHAVLGLALIVSFASFYDNGRTIMGEIPGFFFLISGLYFWLFRGSLWQAGLLLGLAVVCKPSIYFILIPTLVIVLGLRSGWFKNISILGASLFPAILLWLFLVPEQPFQLRTWLELFDSYKDPFYPTSMAVNFIANIKNIIHTPTLIYFAVWFGCVILWRFLSWKSVKNVSSPRDEVSSEFRIKVLYDFVIVYTLFAFVYYLRSPGWLRYTVAAELLLLSLLPHAFLMLSEKCKNFLAYLKLTPAIFSCSVMFFLVAFQVFHLFHGAKIYRSDSDMKTATYLAGTFPNESVAYFNSINVSIFKERPKRLMTLDWTVVPHLSLKNTFKNVDPFSIKPLPSGAVFHKGQTFPVNVSAEVPRRYSLLTTMGGYDIYKLK